MSRISLSLPVVTILLLCDINASGAMESGELQEISEGLITGICGNHQYRECINLSKADCSEALQNAIYTCPQRYMKSLEREFVDMPCITSKFFEEAKVPDKLAVACDQIFAEEVVQAKERTRVIMPNNAPKPTQ